MAKSKNILITGCSSGIGEATAQRLSRAGHRVFATARKLDDLASLAADGCETLALDVCDSASMEAAVTQIQAEVGAIDVLVNNAGYSQSGAIEDVDLALVRTQFETNVFGLIGLTQLVLPGMRSHGSGRIINISSMGANFTFPGGGLYHATKYALESVSDALRFEVAGFGIQVVLIQPGLIRTHFGDRAVAQLGAADGGANGPYAGFNAAVAKATAEVYEDGPLAKLGGEPDAVAKVIEKAMNAKRPKARYRVTPSAHLLIASAAMTPDRVWDAAMRAQFPQPGRS